METQTQFQFDDSKTFIADYIQLFTPKSFNLLHATCPFVFDNDLASELFAIITHYDKYCNKLHLKEVDWIICNNYLIFTTIEKYFVHIYIDLKELIWNKILIKNKSVL